MLHKLIGAGAEKEKFYYQEKTILGQNNKADLQWQQKTY